MISGSFSSSPSPSIVGHANLQQQLGLFHKVGDPEMALGRVQLHQKAIQQVHFEGIAKHLNGFG
jgi:hypothetical protein